MANLPTVGGDSGLWGSELNAYLLVGHDSAGHHSQWVNVKENGAVGDGVTDDSTALQAIFDAVRLAGGGTVYFPVGTYRVTTHTHPVRGGPVANWVGSNTLVRGAGVGATIIKLANSQPNDTWILSNYQTSATYTDSNISVCDLTIDGNASNQDTAGTVDLQYGLKFHGVNGVTMHNVEVKNVCGTNAGGTAAHGSASGEGMHFDLNACTHVAYSQCRAYSDGVMQTSTGFSANRSNDVAYVNCWAYGLLHGQGFTHWTCWSMRYANSWAASCGNDGFHSEFTDGIFYSNCQSGGTTNANLTNPYAASTNLGSSVGFHIFNGMNFHITNCIGQRNINYGVMIEAATGPGEIVGGSWNNNNYGIRLQDAASVTQTTIKGRPDCSNNTTSPVWYNGAVFGFTTFPTAPTVPATTVALTNPFPCDMMVYLTGGTVTVVAVDTTTVFTATPCTVRVRQGGTIALTYSATPTWKWQAA